MAIVKVVRDQDLGSTLLVDAQSKVQVNIDGTSIVSTGGVLSVPSTGVVNDLVALSGLAANTTTLGTFTGGIVPDNANVKAAIQALETAVESLNISGQYAGSSATFSGLPTTTADGKPVNNGDWAILTVDDGSNQSGVYAFNGTSYNLAKEIPEVFTLIVSTTNTSTVTFSGNGTSGSPLSANVVIDPVAGNALTSSITGIKVLSQAITKTFAEQLQGLDGVVIGYLSTTSTF